MAVFAGDSKEETKQAQESKVHQEPYSVLSRSDKWLIVGISTIASMFRFALKSFGACTARLSYSNAIAHSQQTFTSLLFLPWWTISIHRQSSST